MGERQDRSFQLSFDVSLKFDFPGSRVTSHCGLILLPELDERKGFSELIAEHLIDSQGKNTQFRLADLLRQSVYSKLVGYENVNDPQQLSQASTTRELGSRSEIPV